MTLLHWKVGTFSYHLTLLGALALSLVTSGAAYAAGVKGPTPKANGPFVLDSSYAQRVKESPNNQPLAGPSLVFPLHPDKTLLPVPKLFQAGRIPLRYPDLDSVVWRNVPKKEGHDEYLKKRQGLVEAGKERELIRWCRSKGLDDCAEYELRRKLAQIWDFRKPGYKQWNDQWLKLSGKRQTRYTFPLPVKGEWFVIVDRTGHHRIKAGAAYAFDLVIMKNGRQFSRNPSRLEDYYCWGQPICAQADGVVTQVEDKNRDAGVGRSGGFNFANYVSVDYGGGIRGFYGHIQKGSAKVKTGQRVKFGQPLALVGNSGASGIPHLHFTMVDRYGFSVKGKFRYESKRGMRWTLVDGEDLREGVFVRNAQGPRSRK